MDGQKLIEANKNSVTTPSADILVEGPRSINAHINEARQFNHISNMTEVHKEGDTSILT